MADHPKAPRDNFSLDEILAEARVLEAENHVAHALEAGAVHCADL